MPKKVTHQDKIELLDHYIAKPRGVRDPEILRAIKLDVVKCTVPGTKKGSEVDLTLYNQCMGIYREFLRLRDSSLDLKGRKATKYKEAMLSLIEWIRKMQRNNKKPHADADVLNGMKFMFAHWDRLSDWHKNRLALPDIYDKIEEIIPMIKNAKSNTKAGAQTAIPGSEFGKL